MIFLIYISIICLVKLEVTRIKIALWSYNVVNSINTYNQRYKSIDHI